MAWKINQSQGDIKEMERVMDRLGSSTASKAILEMLHTYIKNYEEFRRCRVDLERVSNEFKHLKQLINERDVLDRQIIEVSSSV